MDDPYERFRLLVLGGVIGLICIFIAFIIIAIIIGCKRARRSVHLNREILTPRDRSSYQTVYSESPVAGGPLHLTERPLPPVPAPRPPEYRNSSENLSPEYTELTSGQYEAGTNKEERRQPPPSESYLHPLNSASLQQEQPTRAVLFPFSSPLPSRAKGLCLELSVSVTPIDLQYSSV